MKFHDASFFSFISAAIAGTEPVSATVETKSDEVERYWPVLEHGSREGHRPWPKPRKKTVHGAGGRIFSRQAVGGFVAKNRRHFLQYLRDAYLRHFARTKMPLTEAEARSAANEAASRAAALLKASIPVDTGKAKNSLFARKR